MQGGEDGDRDRDRVKSQGIGQVLLKILSDDDSLEICREKAAICLQLFLTKIFGEDEDDGRQTMDRKSFLQEFYIKFCTVFHARFLSHSPSSNGSKTVEEAEEIRLIIVQILSDVVIHMGSAMKKNESSTSEKDREIESLTYYKRTTAATSLVCQSLSTTALADKYPDLKRASCVLLKAIAEVFPHVVRMHGESLLCPITGGSIQFGQSAGEHGNGNTMLVEQYSFASSKICLLRHRHAKTRTLALEATTDIMSCCNISAEDFTEDNPCQGESSLGLSPNIISNSINTPKARMHVDRNDEPRFSDLLTSHVLPSLESFPPYDHSVAVRTALSKTVGSLLRLLMKGNGSGLENQTFHKKLCSNNLESLEKICISPTGRLLALLIMGLSDKAEIVRTTSSAEFQSIDTSWSGGRNAKIEAINFFSVFSLDVVTVLLLNISNTFSIEERMRSLETLSVTIQILNQKQCQVTGNGFVPYWDESVMTKIVIVLCKSLRDNEKVLFQAAVDCSDTLGRFEQSRRSASGIILPALFGEQCPLKEALESPLHHLTTNTEICERIIYSSPQQFTSALCLIAGLIRGGSSSESSEISLDISEIDEISRAMTNERVFENVFVSSETAIALFDVSRALVRSASDIVDSFSDSNPNGDGAGCYDGNSVVPNILYSCVYLLGCPDTYGLYQPVLILLKSLSCALLGEESSSGILLGVHFRHIFDLITNKPDEKAKVQRQRWEIGDPDLCAFDALLRHTSGSDIGKHFDVVSHILEHHLEIETASESSQPTTCESSGYETKLFIMALMESIVSNPTFPKDCLHRFTEKLIGSAIIPNLAWQVGGMASALRKLSAAVLFSILSCVGDTTSARGLRLLAPSLLPVLKSNLTDDDASTRELVAASLEKLFKILPAALGEETVHQLYPDLMKCLDDSTDSVRYATCNTLKHFLKAAPRENFGDTAIEFIVEKLFVHMDDPEPNFQEMVFDVLVIASDVDSSVVLKNIETALMSHKNQRLCNLLREHIGNKMTSQKIT